MLDKQKLLDENKKLNKKIEEYEYELNRKLLIEEQDKIESLKRENEIINQQLEDKNREISLLETNKSNWSKKYIENNAIKNERDTLISISKFVTTCRITF